MISYSADGAAHNRALFPIACCELVKVNLTIIIIQRITHAFDCAFGCAFDKTNVCGSHSNTNTMSKVRIQVQMHLQFYGGV